MDEYVAMFGLREPDLVAGPILDCPGGAGGFAAGARRLGGRVVSADPAYAQPPGVIAAAVRAGWERGYRYLAENMGSYVWTFFASPEDLIARRAAALEEFRADYAGPGDARYVAAALPGLPFADASFRLALSAYLLFTYPDHFDRRWHAEALDELARVADEVRVFPLIDTAYRPYPELEGLRRSLAARGHASEVRRVDYELQRGGNEMLVVARGGAPAGGR